MSSQKNIVIKLNNKSYLSFIKELKQSIAESRYQSARLVNRELLLLYFKTGKNLSQKIEEEKWGAKVVEKISKDIQKSFAGLRGFSRSNLFNMTLFSKAYSGVELVQTLSGQLNKKMIDPKEKSEIKKKPELVQTVSGLIGKSKKMTTSEQKNNSVQTVSALFSDNKFSELFFQVGFSQHILILQNCTDIAERVFYLTKAATNQWTYRILEYHIESNLYKRKGKIQNNFSKTLPAKIRKHAIDAFKDEYFLDFLNIKEDDNEKVLEQSIINNIRQFLSSLGNEFTFVGNQFRLVVDGEEYSVDLLFFHRKLQSLIAFDLKTGKFKPEHAGKMNFYLSALNDKIKLKHENPSIGIILCKEKSKAVVEYAFRDMSKAIGVAVYKYSKQLPKEFQKYLPSSETLIKLMNKK